MGGSRELVALFCFYRLGIGHIWILEESRIEMLCSVQKARFSDLILGEELAAHLENAFERQLQGVGWPRWTENPVRYCAKFVLKSNQKDRNR